MFEKKKWNETFSTRKKEHLRRYTEMGRRKTNAITCYCDL